MAARKKSARKKSRKSPARTNALKRMQASLPPSLRPYAKRLRTLVARFERQLQKAGTRYRSEAARLLRGAGSELERLERRGEGTWQKLDARTRKRTLKLLGDLQKTVHSARLGTGRGRARARRAVRGASRAMRKAAARVAR